MVEINFKELRELLRGTDYKIVDCSRKAIFDLPAGAFKLWWVYYMAEDDDDGSYLGHKKLMARTKYSRNTLRKWQRVL